MRSEFLSNVYTFEVHDFAVGDPSIQHVSVVPYVPGDLLDGVQIFVVLLFYVFAHFNKVNDVPELLLIRVLLLELRFDRVQTLFGLILPNVLLDEILPVEKVRFVVFKDFLQERKSARHEVVELLVFVHKGDFLHELIVELLLFILRV